ncbi:hypothetical protein F4810DRAFT_716565 [Camillea tinctor]|nr:hypothetical protein F4810DRAFT_716565 [Camillea tinctor]
MAQVARNNEGSMGSMKRQGGQSSVSGSSTGAVTACERPIPANKSDHVITHVFSGLCPTFTEVIKERCMILGYSAMYTRPFAPDLDKIREAVGGNSACLEELATAVETEMLHYFARRFAPLIKRWVGLTWDRSIIDEIRRRSLTVKQEVVQAARALQSPILDDREADPPQEEREESRE